MSRQAPATGSHPTRREKGGLRGRPSWWGEGTEAREWGQGTGGSTVVSRGHASPQVWLRLCETQSMPLCLCRCEAECVCRREAKCDCVCVTETKIILVCVLGVTQGWRVRLMSLKWVWPHHSGVGTDHSSAPFQSHSCPGGCKPRWGQRREGGQREPQAPPPPSSVTRMWN